MTDFRSSPQAKLPQQQQWAGWGQDDWDQPQPQPQQQQQTPVVQPRLPPWQQRQQQPQQPPPTVGNTGWKGGAARGLPQQAGGSAWGDGSMVRSSAGGMWGPGGGLDEGGSSSSSTALPASMKGPVTGFLSLGVQRVAENQGPHSKAAGGATGFYGAHAKAGQGDRPQLLVPQVGVKRAGFAGDGGRSMSERLGFDSSASRPSADKKYRMMTPKQGFSYAEDRAAQELFNEIMSQDADKQNKEVRKLASDRKKEEEELFKKQQDELERQQAELLKQQEEIRKIEEERKKLEDEEKRREADEEARVLQAEMEVLVAIAETKLAVASDVTDVGPAKTQMEGDEIIQAAERFDFASGECTAALKECATFTQGKHRTLVGSSDDVKKSASELIARVGKVDRALSAQIFKVRSQKVAAEQQKVAEARKQAAIAEAKKQQDIFSQFDSDDDGLLSTEDITYLCRCEYQFELQSERLEVIKRSECFKPTQGVPFLKFTQLKQLITIARGEVLAKQRKEEAEKRKAKAQEQMNIVKDNTKEVNECMSSIEAEVTKAEHKALPLSALQRRGAAIPVNIETTIEFVETSIDAAKDFMAAAQEQMEKIGGEQDAKLEAEAVQMMKQQTQNISLRLKHFENRLARTSVVAKAIRDKLELQRKKEELLREASMMA